jgi:hypothetical protein
LKLDLDSENNKVKADILIKLNFVVSTIPNQASCLKTSKSFTLEAQGCGLLKFIGVAFSFLRKNITELWATFCFKA